MCRHLGYLGPSRTVADVLTAGGERSLLTQSWAPREMRGGGVINADGFGAAWWPPGRDPVAYRNPAPVWSDPAVEGALGEVAAPAVVAAVRSATVGMPLTREACAPFTDGKWAFSHNGSIDGWPDSIAALAEWLPAVELLRMPALTDSALLWTMVRRRLDTEEPGQALRSVLIDVLEAAPLSRLNLLLSDGTGLWASAVYHSLSVRVDESVAVVASEPVDEEEGWLVVPDRHLLEARPGHLEITELEASA
ncbi:ergothioneine biosynthesis protein EgtC [Rhodococcus spelaei]|uniref:Gamma-glutamyl-hercynylcysteine sulfoxide hydrolase n=1 Tax=Rhodococcus spelaei TaxID=2546320 RepID=A0A541BNV8_9NOCA|nr:ergothioneine biosynthesis protein EgtC [Rhodococcus spelaei]TQF73970.1 ergothioneine biosynthesis protein EgtC [Rhodococcus spelaei]